MVDKQVQRRVRWRHAGLQLTVKEAGKRKIPFQTYLVLKKIVKFCYNIKLCYSFIHSFIHSVSYLQASNMFMNTVMHSNNLHVPCIRASLSLIFNSNCH